MGIKIMDTRDYHELSILYTHMKEDLVTSVSMNEGWGPIVSCTKPEGRSVTISSVTV